jgi:hypothetical protein
LLLGKGEFLPDFHGFTVKLVFSGIIKIVFLFVLEAKLCQNSELILEFGTDLCQKLERGWEFGTCEVGIHYY